MLTALALCAGCAANATAGGGSGGAPDSGSAGAGDSSAEHPDAAQRSEHDGGLTTTDAGSAAAAGDGGDAGLAADADADAGALRPEAELACYASCSAQIEDCATIDEADCHGLCDYAIATMAGRAGCLELGIASWECDVTQAWQCDPAQQVVGIPVDSQVCAAEVAALDAAGCG